MNATKLFYYLNGLSQDEVEGFKYFLISPVNGVNKPDEFILIIDLFEQHLLYGKPDKSRAEFLAIYSPETGLSKMNDTKMVKTFNKIVPLVMDYFAELQLKKDKFELGKLTLRFLNQRERVKYFPTEYKKAIKKLELYTPLTPDYLSELFELAQEMTRYIRGDQNRNPFPGLESSLSRLEDYYRCQKLEFACLILNQTAALADQIEIEGLEQLLFDIEQNYDSSPFLIRLYYSIYQSILYPDIEQYFYQLKDLMAEMESNFEQIKHPIPPSAKIFYQYLLNYSIREFNKGKDEFGKSALFTYLQLVKQAWYLEKGQIRPEEYKNIVSFAAKIGKLGILESFIVQHENNIFKDPFQNAKHFGRAVLYFYKKEFESSRRYLYLILKKYPKDPFYGHHARKLLYKCQYELKDLENIEYELESWRQFVNNDKKLNEGRKASFKQFHADIKRLWKLSILLPEKRKGRIIKMITALEARQPTENELWLIEKTNELLS